MAGMDPQRVTGATCGQCGAALAPEPGLRFCGSCGAPAPAPREDAAAVARYGEVLAKFGAADGRLDGTAEEQLAALRQRLGISLGTHERLRAELAQRLPAARVRLFIDAQTLRHFAVGTRCMIRLKLENAGALALDPVAIYAEVVGGERLPTAHGAAVFPGQSAVLPLWLVPTMPGFFALRGVVQAVDLAGTPSYFGFSAVEFRVGEAGDGSRVSIVNIDQSAARVVDNSRSQFASAGADRGGLVGAGEFHPVALQPLTPQEAAARCPELAPALLAVDATADRTPETTSAAPLLPIGARVNFTIKTERGEYVILARMAPGVGLQLHYHTGPAQVYTFQGCWFYREYPDQPQTAGSYLYEPGGSVHTFFTPEDNTEDTVALIIVDAALHVLEHRDGVAVAVECHRRAQPGDARTHHDDPVRHRSTVASPKEQGAGRISARHLGILARWISRDGRTPATRRCPASAGHSPQRGSARTGWRRPANRCHRWHARCPA